MSRPSNRMRPALGASSPAICATKVVLPAPFGPMIACTSPGNTVRSMPELAKNAPKRLVSPVTARIGSATAPPQQDHREHDDAEDRHPVLGVGGKELLEQ